MMNHYKTLGLEDFASIEEIRTAHRKLSKRYHPDLNNGNKHYEEKFKEIQHAYEQLRDPEMKAILDDYLRSQYKSEHTYQPPPYYPPPEEYVKPWWERMHLSRIAAILITLSWSVWYNFGHPFPMRPPGPHCIGATKKEILKKAGAPDRVSTGDNLVIWTYGTGVLTIRQDTVIGYADRLDVKRPQ